MSRKNAFGFQTACGLDQNWSSFNAFFTYRGNPFTDGFCLNWFPPKAPFFNFLPISRLASDDIRAIDLIASRTELPV